MQWGSGAESLSMVGHVERAYTRWNHQGLFITMTHAHTHSPAVLHPLYKMLTLWALNGIYVHAVMNMFIWKCQTKTCASTCTRRNKTRHIQHNKCTHKMKTRPHRHKNSMFMFMSINLQFLWFQFFKSWKTQVLFCKCFLQNYQGCLLS